MRHRAVVMLALAAIVVGGGALPAAADGPSTAAVRTWPAPGVVVAGASATLVRQPDGASFTFRTSGLAPGSVSTIWFVAFNNPSACLHPMMDGPVKIANCSVPDLMNAAAEPTAVWGAGHVIGGNGKATFGGRVQVGDTSGCDSLGRLPCNDGLTNPAGADIHLVVRTHGPMIPDLVNEQLHSFNRACEAGEPNVGLCANRQFALFDA